MNTVAKLFGPGGVRMAEDQSCFRCGRRYESDGMRASPAGNVFCETCWSLINPRNEMMRKCPVDGANMKKRLVAEAVVIDVCTQCGGLWSDKGELEIIERKSRQRGWQDGFFLSVMLL